MTIVLDQEFVLISGGVPRIVKSLNYCKQPTGFFKYHFVQMYNKLKLKVGNNTIV